MTTNFTYSFESSQSTETIFETLLDIRKWWYGIFDETITGESKNINDVFTSKQVVVRTIQRRNWLSWFPTKK